MRAPLYMLDIHGRLAPEPVKGGKHELPAAKRSNVPIAMTAPGISMVYSPLTWAVAMNWRIPLALISLR